MTSKKRIAAIVLACVFAFVMIFSVAFVALEAEHNCTGNDCHICYELSVCVQAISALKAVILISLCAILLSSCLVIFSDENIANDADNTLVSLKVKLTA